MSRAFIPHVLFIAVAAFALPFVARAQLPTGLSPGDILVADYSGPDGVGRLFWVDRATGHRVMISDFGDPTQGIVTPGAFGVTVTDNNTILMVDSLGGPGLLLHVNPLTGFRTVLSDFGNPFQGPLGEEPVGIAVINGQTLVTDKDAGTAQSGALFRVNRATGPSPAPWAP
jgi:hypothetical protein